MSERTWVTAEDPDEEVDWSVHLGDDHPRGAGDRTDAPLVVFVHIQKTAGKTLRTVLRRQYAGEGRSLHVPNYFPKPEDHWATVDRLTRDRPPGLEAAHGHMLFVPDRWPRDARFITILRDPAERTISHFYWLRERRGTRSPLSSIEEALDQGAIRDNLQTRVLAGADPSGPVTATMAEDAIAALDRFAAVGLTERFDESLVLFGRALGWRTEAYERVNSTNSRAPKAALGATTIERIEEHTRYDREVYAVAASRFDELMRSQTDEFRVEVDIVRAAAARTSLDKEWPDRQLTLSIDGMDAREVLVTGEAARLAAELDRRRLAEASRQIAALQTEIQSKVRTSGGYAEHYGHQALRDALLRIEELETAQRGAKQKIARARKRLGSAGLDTSSLEDSEEPARAAERPRKRPPAKAGQTPKAAQTAKKAKPAGKKPKQPRDQNAPRKPKQPAAKRPAPASPT